MNKKTILIINLNERERETLKLHEMRENKKFTEPR